MRKLGLALAGIGLVILVFLVRFVLGTIAFLVKAGITVVVTLLLTYALYELWTGWKQAGQ